MKNTALIVSIVFLSLLIVGLAYVSQDEDICCKYEICSKLTTICDKEEVQGSGISSLKGETIILDNLKEGDILVPDFKVNGSVTGGWFFEGVFPVRVLNEQGEVIRTIFANASQDWMTEELVPFSFVLDLDIEEDSNLVLKFERSNPSGLAENDDSAQIAVTMKAGAKAPESKTITVKAFFGNSKLNPTVEDCSLVYPVSRQVDETVAVGRASLQELFKGTTDVEEEEGYYTNINEGVEILSLTIEEGVAKVDLSSELEEGVGGSCKVTAIRSQIEETLKQFSTVESVIISIEGKSEDILQP